MDTENKKDKSSTPVTPANLTSEQKPEEQAPASPSPAPADSKEASSSAKPDAKLDAVTTPPSSDSVTSAKRSASGLWLLVIVAAVVCAAGGFVLGQGTSRASDNNNKQQSPGPTAAQNKKDVRTKISGKVKTDAHGLNYFVLDVSEYGSVKAKKHETRYILEPQANREYEYVFDGLLPNVSYTVTMQGCAEKDQVSSCVLSRKVVSCSGRIPGGALQQCLIAGDGEADFFLDKSLVSEMVAVLATPTPTLEPTATPTPTP